MTESRNTDSSSAADWEIIGNGATAADESGASLAATTTDDEKLEAISFSVTTTATSRGEGEVALSTSNSACDNVEEGEGAITQLSSVSLGTSSVARTKRSALGTAASAAAPNATEGAAAPGTLKGDSFATSLEKERLLLQLEDMRGEIRKAKFASDAKVEEVDIVSVDYTPLRHPRTCAYGSPVFPPSYFHTLPHSS